MGDNVIQAFGHVKNPQLAEDDAEAAMREERKAAMLERLDTLKSRIERDQIDGIMFLGIGAPGYPELRLVSEAMYERPTLTVGLLETIKTEIQMELFIAMNADVDDDD